MNPGPQLDALIAEKVMNIIDYCKCGNLPVSISPTKMVMTCLSCEKDKINPYSRSIVDAWEVVEKLASQGFGYCIEKAPDATRPTVHLIREKQTEEEDYSLINFVEDMETIKNSSSSLPHNICLAALKAVGVEV